MPAVVELHQSYGQAKAFHCSQKCVDQVNDRASNPFSLCLEACVVDVRFDFVFAPIPAVNFKRVVRFAEVNLPVVNLSFLFQFV